MSSNDSVSLYEFKGYKNSFLIGEVNNENRKVNYQKVPKLLFKYVSLSTAKKILNDQELRFSIPKVFPDKREGALYLTAMNHLDKKEVGIDDFYTCCFTMAKVSENFTQNYSTNSLYKAIFDMSKDSKIEVLDVISNSIGVCFKFSNSKFRHSLLKTLKSDDKFRDYKLLEGKIRYYSRNTIDNQVNNIEMETVIYNSDDGTSQIFNNEFCNLILKKNNNFAHEQEYRYFVGLKDCSEDNQLPFKIDFKDCLQEIFIYANQAVLIHDFDKTMNKMKEVESEIKEICRKNNLLEDLTKVHIIDLYTIDDTQLL